MGESMPRFGSSGEALIPFACSRLGPELLAAGVGSDALLILLGIAGVSAALREAPQLQRAMWTGVTLMVWHAAVAARRAVVGSVQQLTGSAESRRDRRSELLVSP